MDKAIGKAGIEKISFAAKTENAMILVLELSKGNKAVIGEVTNAPDFDCATASACNQDFFLWVLLKEAFSKHHRVYIAFVRIWSIVR